MLLDWPCCKKALHAPTTCEPCSPKKDASAYRISCIAVRTPLAKTAAYGPWSWQPRSVSSKGSSPQRCPPKVCGEPSNDSKPLGNAPSTGLPAPTRCTSKKNARDRLIAWASHQPAWAIGFQDEVWWSRFALPRLNAWQDAEHPVRLVEQSWKKGDPDPKALACYGVLWQEGTPEEPKREQMWLRFVTGRPVSAITTQFLEWCCQRLLKGGKTNWLLIWDNASWHKSQAVRIWIRQHNQQVKQTDTGVRILPFLLPTQSPWLNPIEPKWVHGKRNVVEADGLLSAKQLAERVCAYYGTPYESHLVIPEKVS